jgi:hypothetical protein
MSGNKVKSQSEHNSFGTQPQTFTLRIWVTNQQDSALEWRGRIQHIQSGEVQYCQNWDAFITYVEDLIRNPHGI